MMRKGLIVLLAVALAASGCSGMSATQVGQTTGALAGAAVAPGIGMPIGALVGTLAGLVVDSQLDKAREQKERVELGRQMQVPPKQRADLPGEPGLGEPARVWVDEHIEEGRLMAGRFELRRIM